MKVLKPAQIEEMFLVYQEKQTLKAVVDTCKISYPTASKYRKSHKWDERLAKIQDAVVRRVSKKDENHRVRHAKIGMMLQAKGVDKIQNMTRNEIDPRLAKDLIKDGVDMERTAIGDVPVDNVIVLVLPPGMEGIR